MGSRFSGGHSGLGYRQTGCRQYSKGAHSLRGAGSQPSPSRGSGTYERRLRSAVSPCPTRRSQSSGPDCAGLARVTRLSPAPRNPVVKKRAQCAVPRREPDRADATSGTRPTSECNTRCARCREPARHLPKSGGALRVSLRPRRLVRATEPNAGRGTDDRRGVRGRPVMPYHDVGVDWSLYCIMLSARI